MKNIKEEYIKCAEICAQIDYSDKKSVRANNRAVDKMYRLVERAKFEGPESIAGLIDLLDHSLAGSWIAHQLVERVNFDIEIAKKCFEIIEPLAHGESANALGETWWLAENRKKFNI